jgi:hypothetical protein
MAFKDLFQGSTLSTPTTTITSAQLPDWAANIQRKLLEGAVEAAPEYEYYDPAQRVAPLSTTEQQAIGDIPAAAGSYMPGLAAGFGSLGAATRGVADTDYSQYMNPYTQYVTDIAKREAVRDFEKMRPQMGYQASRQGAFGGARYGVQEAEAERNLGQRLTDIQQAGLERAFTAGTGLRQQEAQRELAASPLYAAMGQQAQQMGLGGLDAILKSQALPRQLEQQQRDLAYQEYLRGQGFDLGQIERLGGIFRGVAPQGTTTQVGQTITPQSSPLATAAGLGLAGAGIYNLFGSNTPAGSSYSNPLGNAVSGAWSYIKGLLG